MSTSKENSIIPMGKAVSLINRTVTGHEFSKLLVSESDSVKFSVYAISVGMNYNFRVYQLGSETTKHKTLIYTSDTMTTIHDPIVFTVPATGALEFLIHLEGDLTIEVTGCGIRTSVLPEVTLVEAILTGDDITHRNAQLSLLDDINENLIKINNHLRQITGIEAEESETF